MLANMKNIILKAALVVLAGLLSVSCAKEYLDTLPEDATSPGTIFETTENAKLTINGLSRLMTKQYMSNQGYNGEGTIMAVEYNGHDRDTLEDNVNRFGLNNVTIIDHVDEESMKGLPVPDVTMLVASASMEQEMETLLKINPEMEFVIYTLDFVVAAELPKKCAAMGMRDPEVIQIAVSKLTTKNTYSSQPAPWIISARPQ